VTVRILVVCLGNICRSPAAEAAIRTAAVDAGIPVEVESAGTSRYHLGEPPHPESRRAGAEVGLTIEGRARQVTVEDFERFDLIVAMDRDNLRDLLALAPDREAAAKVRLFRHDGADVPDPWGRGYEAYRQTMATVVEAAARLVDEVASTGG
jgi:protein-tyrosine phosphatase